MCIDSVNNLVSTGFTYPKIKITNQVFGLINPYSSNGYTDILFIPNITLKVC